MNQETNKENNKETININFIGITGNIYPKKFYSTNTIRDLKLAVTQLTEYNKSYDNILIFFYFIKYVY